MTDIVVLDIAYGRLLHFPRVINGNFSSQKFI